MSPEKLTETSLKALMLAQNLAAEKQHQYIEPDHLLLAILEQTDSLGVRLLQLAEVDINRVKTEIDDKLKQLPQVGGTSGQYLSRGLDEILRKAEKEADKNGDSFVSVDLLFYVLIRETDYKKLIDLPKLEQALNKIRGKQKVTNPTSDQNFESLSKFGIDFTELARNGKLDPVIGRDEEIRRTMQILLRRTKITQF